MMYNEEIVRNLNGLLQATFQMNSFADNCAYWLACNYFIETEEEFHSKFAHVFPEWADNISNMMINLNIRPVRLSLQENTKNYENHFELFEDVYTMMLNYKQKVCDAIELVEFYDAREIVIILEEHLLKILSYIKQTNIWKVKASQINDVSKFDKYFDDFTII